MAIFYTLKVIAHVSNSAVQIILYDTECSPILSYQQDTEVLERIKTCDTFQLIVINIQEDKSCQSLSWYAIQ
jgi:hypothetical protein